MFTFIDEKEGKASAYIANTSWCRTTVCACVFINIYLEERK